MGDMLENVVKKMTLNQSSTEDELSYWLGKTPEERLAAVETLRRQIDGSPAGLQRVTRVIQRSSR